MRVPRLLSHLAHLVRLARAAHSAVLAPWQHVHMSRGSSLRATEPSSQGGGGGTHGVARFAGPATEPLFRICPLWFKNQWPLPAVASDRGQGGNGPRRAGRGRVAGRLRVGPGRDLRRALRACPRPTMADAGAPLLRRPFGGGASSQRASGRFEHYFDCSGALGALPVCVFILPI